MDGSAAETCDECGFDGRAWRVRDAATIFDNLGSWWRMATDDVALENLRRRPAEKVWSVLEYGRHSATVMEVLFRRITQIVEEDGADLPAASREARELLMGLDRDEVLDALERGGKSLAGLARKAPATAWNHSGTTPDGQSVQAEAALLHAVHDASHHMFDVARGLDRSAPPIAGRIEQVNASDGGVPKRALPGGQVDAGGLVGDRQKDRKHHGRPFQALSLWSSEVIDRLAADDHPIGPGYAGENLTVSGVEWTTLRPGSLLRLGEVLAEVSFPAVPCAKQARWFTDGDFRRIDYDRNPHLVRWYAWVREPGAVAPGDKVSRGGVAR